MHPVPAQIPMRKTVTCPHCGLNQYLPVSRLCKRCRWPVGNIQLAIPIGNSQSSANADESLRRTIGTLLRRLRRRHGFSQSELASLLHTHRSLISRVEHGHKLPPLSLLVQAGSLLSVQQVILCMRPIDNVISAASIHDADRDC